jgi:hypothetical protein
MIQLIARPELFEGRRVRVVGFVNLEPEDNGLYLSRSDWENGIRKNGVWIEEPPDSVDGTKNWRWNRRNVLVEGVFTAKSKGHLGLWSGQISDVQRYDPWKGEPPRDDEKRVSR